MSGKVSCPLVEWYSFKKCSIESCKNWSHRTKHQCLELDRTKTASETKIISDSELHLFKINEEQVTTRWVSAQRKEAETRIKYIMVLKRYVDYLLSKPICKKVGIDEYAEKRLSKYPLNVKELGIVEGILPMLLNESLFSQFKATFKGECNDLILRDILILSEKQFTKLQKGITYYG